MAIAAPIHFSRFKLESYLTCRRRFYLRYLRQLAWPALPLPAAAVTAIRRGEQFHRLLERHFLDLPDESSEIKDGRLRQWWHAFQNSGITLPAGRYLPEMSLTIPIGEYWLTGRFDLLILGQDAQTGAPFAHLFDWKTGKPRTVTELAADWQTRLYLAMLVAGGGSLLSGQQHLQPENVQISYWYASEPETLPTIGYSQTQHRQNWAEITALIAQITHSIESDEWPLTENWAHCRECAYQAYCGRQEAGAPQRAEADEDAELMDEALFLLEPDSP